MVVVHDNLVVGYWELITMKPGAGFSAPQDIATVKVAKERPEAKQQRN